MNQEVCVDNKKNFIQYIIYIQVFYFYKKEVVIMSLITLLVVCKIRAWQKISRF